MGRHPKIVIDEPKPPRKVTEERWIRRVIDDGRPYTCKTCSVETEGKYMHSRKDSWGTPYIASKCITCERKQCLARVKRHLEHRKEVADL